MQPSSGTPRAWFRWPCAAALAFALAPGGLVIANSNNACEPSQVRPEDENNTFTNQEKINPCNADPIKFDGRTQQSFRSQTKRDCSMETRSRTRTEAKGIGTQAEYKLLEDFTNVTRFGPQRPERIVERRDERIIAQNKTGAQTVGSTPPVDGAASWFQTARSDTKFNEDGTVARERSDTRCRCKREDEVPDQRCPSSPTT